MPEQKENEKFIGNCFDFSYEKNSQSSFIIMNFYRPISVQINGKFIFFFLLSLSFNKNTTLHCIDFALICEG